MKMRHEFVTSIPSAIEDNVLYISIPFCTAIHKCVCGCGKEVVTPLSPTDWRLTFNGKTVSLYPSIGNWNFECRSHYFITNSEVNHVPRWDAWEVERGRRNDRERKQDYYDSSNGFATKKKSKGRKLWRRLKKKKHE